MERFQDGLASRLRGEPVGNESESAEHPKDDYAEGSGFTEEGAESVDSVETESDAEFEAGQEEQDHSGDGTVENESESAEGDETEDELSTEESEVESIEASGEDDEAETAASDEECEPAESATAEDDGADESTDDPEEKDYSNEWTPEELAELGEDA